MRVIAGSAGGRPLKAPPDGLRPTMDRVRAAVFSSLADLVPEARVLDLFAGSGAMGIEALSRGAASGVFVDFNDRCVRCIRSNLRMAGVEAIVQTMDAYRFLDLHAAAESFDLIFADPPYFKAPVDIDHEARLLESASLASALAEGGLLVLETADSSTPRETTLWTPVRSKPYGGSRVTFWRKS